MVRPDNFKHDIINFCNMRLVDALTQNPIQAGDSLIRSSKSMELVRFLPQVAVYRNEIIKRLSNCRNATTVFLSMTISLQRCIEVTTHNLQVTGRDV